MGSNSRLKAPVSPMVTTVNQHRIGLFQPVKQLQKSGRDIVVENSHGTCTMRKCRLTQIHASIMEALFVSAREAKFGEKGEVRLLVSLPDVLRAMAMSPRNQTWLLDRIEDLRVQRIQASFRGQTVNSPSTEGLLKEAIPDTENVVTGHGSARPGVLYWVVFGQSFSLFYLHDLRVDWRAHLPTLRAMSGPSQAIARYCLTHEEVKGESIIRILELLGQTWKGENRVKLMQKVVRTVMTDGERLGQLGISIDDGAERRVWYNKKETEQKTKRIDVRMLPIVSSELKKQGTRFNQEEPGLIRAVA